MKKISIAIMTLLVMIAACKKVPEVNKEYVDVERDLITVGITSASFQCDYQYIATLKKAYLYYGEGEEAVDMASVEMHVVQNTLCVDITGLKKNTIYSYYYEFVNGFGSMKSAKKTFKTDNNSIGAIDGLFTINADGDQIYFSQGNLQYQASTNTWRFADNQWDYIGCQNPSSGHVGGTVSGSDNAYISSNYSGWIDLFGWGTSGYNGNAPYNTSTDNSDYVEPINGNWSGINIIGTNYDWGVYNAISNGGDQAGLWRTLSGGEFYYMIDMRSTASGIRYAKANVNNVNGLVLLPDNWDASIISLNQTNASDASFSSNLISSSEWEVLENAGAVFLPAGGARLGTSVSDVGSVGCFWSVSYLAGTAYHIFFDANSIISSNSSTQCQGFSVRLVHDIK